MNKAFNQPIHRWDIVRQSLSRLSGENFELHNVRLPSSTTDDPRLPHAGDGLVAANLKVSSSGVRVVAPTAESSVTSVDLGGSLVWPCTVDCHTHIDKGQTWPRVANGDGTFQYAIKNAGRAVNNYLSESDQRCRSEFMLRSAYAHGCSALRSHIDADREFFHHRYGILSELAEDWSGRITVQLCPLTGVGEDSEWISELAGLARGIPGGTLSVVLTGTELLDDFLDLIIGLGNQNDIGLDFHADENLNPGSKHLESIARAVLRHKFEGPVLVGHCCSLSVQSDEVVDGTLDLVAEAGIGIVALPHSNSYLQDRRGRRSPRLRGIAPVKEIAGRGIPVALASDNARDAFSAYGDLDLPELFRDAIRIMQLDHPVGDWPAAVTSTAANLMGLSDGGRINSSSRANLIIFPARNWSEFGARALSDRLVMREGKLIDSTPPDFSELDSLQGMQP